MATKTFYATRDMKNPTGYGTRMLKAGDPVDLTGPQARLYRAIGAVSPKPPAKAVVPAMTTDTVAPPAPPTPENPKPAPRKRTARRKK